MKSGHTAIAVDILKIAELSDSVTGATVLQTTACTLVKILISQIGAYVHVVMKRIHQGPNV